ncbi:Dihydroorotase multifunctional complex type [uncultured Alphaproteobacteria bacterium]|uniref:Dihydroorotase multifunctional complex type n=1 Tax=uncultured Alphaproteobacteria bacterium TaxID=91750 RepID=A0A212KMB6_9PROT|nr:Dihydroorotase multifunctional complex type [uncultured Alphaproteobacteria bacterium]
MADRYDWVLRGAAVFTPKGLVSADIGVSGGRIAKIGDIRPGSGAVEDSLSGLTVLPGVIDTQVHFREPGAEHKEDLATGTAAAAKGGVTAICDMPNTKPNTTSPEALADKVARGKRRAWVDYAFYLGATAENAADLAAWENLPGCCGIKVFMGSSTGTLLVDEQAALETIFATGKRRVAVHAEDETRLKARYALVAEGAPVPMHPVWRDEETATIAVRRLIDLARRSGRATHCLHVTSAGEMELLRDRPANMTVEVTPQHLTLAAPDAYDRLGTFAQMNPPIRDARHRDALWAALKAGVVSCLGSDHAPHTREEKAQPYPKSPSGMPGVQTLVPVMLDHVNAGRLGLSDFVRLASANPARMFGMAGRGAIAEGYRADFTIVDMGAERTIADDWIASRCGWTPFAGMRVTGWPVITAVGGRVVMREDALIGTPKGAPIAFDPV